MPALALVTGAILGYAARRRQLPLLTIALAGLPGPALLTLAYLIAGPGSGADHYQVVPYWAAMTATGAGVLGSVLAAVLRRASGPDDESDVDRDSPTADRPPLPERSAQTAVAPAAESDSPLRASDAAAFGAPGGRRAEAPEGFTGHAGEPLPTAVSYDQAPGGERDGSGQRRRHKDEDYVGWAGDLGE